MQSSGQITFADPKKIRNFLPQTKTPHHNHSPPVKNQTASHFEAVLDYLLDKPQRKVETEIKSTKVVQEVVKDVKKEVLKDTLKDRQENAEKLAGLVNKSNNNLLTISSVFPFTLFPTKVSVDPDKVSVTFTEFFESENFQTMLIKEITHVEVQTDLFFGSLKLRDSADRAHEIVVKFLKKTEAEKAREIIQGLIVGTKQGINFTQFEPETLTKKVKELGQTAPQS